MTTFSKKTVRDLPLHGQTVLLRADYNVPQNKDGTIADDYRITQSLPTVQYLLTQKCKVVICSHLGRPDGRAKAEYSLEPVAQRLSELLGQPVDFVPNCVGDQVKAALKKPGKGGIFLLENLRFHPEEEQNDAHFAKKLASSSGAQYFVQDGFGAVHRAHASTAAITQFLPSVAGLLLEKEVVTITSVMRKPKRPFIAILGGAKISDKIEVVERFVELADRLIIGGAMANTFLRYKGLPVGKSLVDPEASGLVQKIYEKAAKKLGTGGKVEDFILLPTDVAVANTKEPEAPRTVKKVTDVQAGEYILDIGPESIEKAVACLRGAGTAVWNGTLGYAELEQFAHGSARVALALAGQPETVSIIGGGDTADFVLKWDARKGGSFTHVSTGGGASLDLMAGKKLPGVEALMDR